MQLQPTAIKLSRYRRTIKKLVLKNSNYIIEYLGTMFLILVYGISGDAIAIGFTLSALIFIGAKTSGAHYNPAITLAAFVLKKINGGQFIGYLCAQLLGAFTGSVIIKYLSGLVYYIEAPFNTLFYQQVTLEGILSYIFVLVALVAWVGNSNRKSNANYALIMGISLIGIVTVGQDVSGAILNPAFSISSSLLDYYYGGSSYLDIPLYAIAPIVASIAAALTYKYLIMDVDLE